MIAKNSTIEFVRKRVLAWGSTNQRSFPWREAPSPYKILIAEICLRRTGAKLAQPVYEDLILRYPSPRQLARASETEVVDLFSNVGLHSRALQLVSIGTELVRKHDGQIPHSYRDLVGLPGVGKYIANAILCFGYGASVPLVDQGIMRLLLRFFGMQGRPEKFLASWPKLRTIKFLIHAKNFNYHQHHR